MSYKSGVSAISIDVALAHQLHQALHFQRKNINDVGNALFAVEVGEIHRTADAYCSRAEGDQCKDVVGVADTTIDIDLHLVEHLGVVQVEVQQDLDGLRREINHAATVVGDVDSREAKIGANLDIMSGLEALGNDRQRGGFAEGLQGGDGEDEVVGLAGGVRLESHLAITDAIDARVVDRQEDGLVAEGLELSKLLLDETLVRPDVFLVEHDLARDCSRGDGLNGLGRFDGRHVENTSSTSRFDDVALGAAIGETG